MGRTKNVILGYLILGLIFVILIQIGILYRGDLLVEVLVYVFFPVALPYLFLRSILSGPHELTQLRITPANVLMCPVSP